MSDCPTNGSLTNQGHSVLRVWPTDRTRIVAESQGKGGFSLADSQLVVFWPVVCAAGMNPAHSWHTMFVRERSFAVGLGMYSFTSEKRVSRYQSDGQDR